VFKLIESLSRFDERLDKLAIELTERNYKSLGDATAFSAKEAMNAIEQLLPSKEEKAMPTSDVLDKLAEQNIKRTVTMDVLTKLAEAGTIRRVGKGQKGSPYRYYKPTADEERDSFKTSAGSGQTNPGGFSENEIHSSATPTLGTDERKNEEF
jgi:hypothetical protein